MLVVLSKERRLDNLEEFIRVQLGGDRVHHFGEQDAHLGPVGHSVHIQHDVCAKPV